MPEERLIFASGLARVFLCALDPEAVEAQRELRDSQSVSTLAAYFTEQLALSPLEMIAKLCCTLEINDTTSRRIFDNYDQFLGVLDDPVKRNKLEDGQGHDFLRQSTAWKEIQEISHPFHQGLVDLFLRDHEGLAALTTEYGIF